MNVNGQITDYFAKASTVPGYVAADHPQKPHDRAPFAEITRLDVSPQDYSLRVAHLGSDRLADNR